MNPSNEIADAALIERALRLTKGFSQWPQPAMDRLLNHARLGRYPRGTLLMAETGPALETLAVVSGHLLVRRMNADGSRSATSILGPGLVAGMSRVLDPDEGVVFDCRAHDDAIVIHLPTQVLLELLDAEPALWREMARMLLRQYRRQLATLLNQMIGTRRQRVAGTVERLARLYGTAEGDRLRLRVSQEDLAALLQVSRQTINKELRALEEGGVLVPDYSSIVILDQNALREIAAGTAPD